MTFNLKTTHILIILMCFSFLMNLSCIKAEETNEEITFLIFGHVYPDYEILDLSIDLIEKENPDFVVFLGDSIAPIHGMYWSSLEPIIKKIKVPVYFAPGNHDLMDSVNGKEFFKEHISEELFQSFDVGNNTFIILDSVGEKESYYDISDEQVSFIGSIYNNDENNKFIFMHHCLFYDDGKQLCNSRGKSISEKSVWNSEIVPIIQNKTRAVFVGDVGVKEPYLSYIEKDVHYFGVGFSPEKLKFPPHMLKVIVSEEEFKVIPIALIQDLTEMNIKIDKSFRSKLKSFILNNLKQVLTCLTISITLLILIILVLLIKWKRK